MTEKKKTTKTKKTSVSSKNKTVKNTKTSKTSSKKKTTSNKKSTNKKPLKKVAEKNPKKTTKVSKTRTLYFKLYDELKDSKRYFATEAEYKRYIKKLAESAPVNQLDLIGSFKKFKEEFLKK